MHFKGRSGTGTDGPGGNITVMTDAAMMIDLDESADIKLNGFCTRTRLNKKLLRLIAAHKNPESLNKIPFTSRQALHTALSEHVSHLSCLCIWLTAVQILMEIHSDAAPAQKAFSPHLISAYR